MEPRELRTLLAALIHWKASGRRQNHRLLYGVAGASGPPMSDDELDALIRRLRVQIARTEGATAP